MESDSSPHCIFSLAGLEAQEGKRAPPALFLFLFLLVAHKALEGLGGLLSGQSRMKAGVGRR
jgi:hypothetical protein